MVRTSLPPPEITIDDSTDVDNNAGDIGIRSNYDRSLSLFKRTHPHLDSHSRDTLKSSSSDRLLSPPASAASGVRHRSRRRGFQFRRNSVIYSVILIALFGFVFASIVLQSSITNVFRQAAERRGTLVHGVGVGSSLRFVSSSRFLDEGRIHQLRKEGRSGVRLPRLAIILRNTKKNPASLMLFTVMKNLQKLGYMLQLYALEDGAARTLWEEIGGRVTILNLERNGHFDWSFFDGVIADSLEVKEVISSLMQEPFCSVPLIWIIQEDRLAKRLPHYNNIGWEHLIFHWRSLFSRAAVVVFPDFSLPILYSALDSGNFFVIPGSPVEAWTMESYAKTHSKHNLRATGGYSADDIVVLVVVNSIFYNELSSDYSAAMRTIGPLLVKYTKGEEVSKSLKFIFLSSNSTGKYRDALKDVAGHLGVSLDSMRHYNMDQDVNGVLLMADIVIYGSLQDEQAFPPLLTRIMSLGIPTVVPDLPVISKYVTDGVNVMIFSKHNSDDLLRIFSLLVSSEGELSKFVNAIGSNGKNLARNLLALESIIGYAKLMEKVISFPSDALLPAPVSQIEQDFWEWDSFDRVTEQIADGVMKIDEEGLSVEESSVVSALEEDFSSGLTLRNASADTSEIAEHDLVIKDLSVVEQLEISEEYKRRETDQIEERMEKDPGVWDEIYRNARKSEKLKFEPNERDEGELERIGSLICIYEVYSGSGAWPFLHHGSLYRGLSLSTKARRLSSDDVDAVNRLPFLNNSRYQDLLCEMGGMFSIAYKVDDIHKKPWIGFQSWRASGRNVSLSIKAERILEEMVQLESKGDTIYFWTHLRMDSGLPGTNDSLSFWQMCDVLNGGKCRTAFQDAFRHMYGLPKYVEALPAMPEDSGHWSSLHSWVMPTSSFLEFIMFTRIFADSLDAVHGNTSRRIECLLGLSDIEKRHCYCRVLELLVNVWAYHSARRMVYIDPHTGMLEEQHPVAQRRGFMWAKYFNFTLLKSMDEDLAEAADDGDFQREAWLWPLTGEVHWQGMYEREREERYRMKMDKKRKLKEKLLERMKYGYRQKSLGR